VGDRRDAQLAGAKADEVVRMVDEGMRPEVAREVVNRRPTMPGRRGMTTTASWRWRNGGSRRTHASKRGVIDVA
jgi:hypothetical protein